MDLFDLKGKTAVVTGGGGFLGFALAKALGAAGAAVLIADINNAEEAASKLDELGVRSHALESDALDIDSMKDCCRQAMKEFKRIDILVNCAGGNQKEATTSPELSFFDLPLKSLQKVVDLNLFAGALIPSQAFAPEMVKNPEGGSIINISSMNAFRPLTRIPGYSAAKAGVSNFTQWLAVHLAKEYNPKIRVNAIAPGFFLTEQNRFLLTDKKGGLTDRGKSILAHTPMGRFGEPSDLEGACLWLASDASKFVTGTIIPIDGGFNAFAGV
jgi:NAD(P)-dependent dehydrogenase (short-subunit alcohol dehydrogenase family)